MTATPIADYALLSDRRTAALVSRDGSVDWLCAPRFDSPAVLGRLLDPGAGHWSVRPVDPDAEATRRYVDDTMLLETTWTTATGTATVTDALATGGADDPHAIGASRAPAARPRAGVHRRRGRDGRGVRAATRVRAGGAAGHGGGGRRRRPGRRRRGGALLPRRARRSPMRPRPGGCGSPRATACCSGCSTARRPNRGPVRCRPRTSTTRCARRPTRGGRGPGCTRTTAGRGAISSTTAAGCCRRCPTSPPARWSPPRRPRCPSRWAASATGTTATPGSGTQLHPRGAVGRRLPGRGPPVLRLPGGQLGGPGPGRSRPADHVRHRRGARPHRARAAAPGRAGAGAGPSASATAPGTSARSTSTASCSAPAHRLVAQLNPDHPGATALAGVPRRAAPTRPRAGGGRRTRGSGRSAASPATSCTPS